MRLNNPLWPLLWLLLVSVFAVSLGRMLFQGFPLQTNILALLPHTEKTPQATHAMDLATKELGRKLLFLVGAGKQADAMAAADILAARLKETQGYTSIQYKVSPTQMQAYAKFYYPMRQQLLSQAQRQQLEESPKNLMASAMATLFGPLGSGRAAMLSEDPFFLFSNYLGTLPNAGGKLSLNHNRLTLRQDGKIWVFLSASTLDSPFSLAAQKRLLPPLNETLTEIEKQYPSVEVLKTGSLFFAAQGSQSAQQEISTIGIGSLLGVIILLLAAFRSGRPLLLSLLSILVGSLAALVITIWCFGSVHLFTLVFGASLIGVSIDYSFHFFAEQYLPQKDRFSGLRHIMPAITMGMLTSVIAYLSLAIAPFPGLRQLALFSAAGLLMAFFTVIALFPHLASQRVYSRPNWLTRGCNLLLQCWLRPTTRQLQLGFAILILASLVAIYHLKANDDIRVLQSSSPELVHNDTKLKQMLGYQFDTRFFVVEGQTPQQVLERQEALFSQLDQLISQQQLASYQGLASWLPSVHTQQQNYQLLHSRYQQLLPEYFSKLGLKNRQQVLEELLSQPFKPVGVKQWLESPVSKNLHFLWQGEFKGQYAGIVLLGHSHSLQLLQQLQGPHITLISKADDISALFKLYRHRIAWILGGAYLAIALLLLGRYGVRRASILMLPPLLAGLLALGATSLMGETLNLFHMLALMLVLGIGVDYTLFFAEAGKRPLNTLIAIALSAVTTLLSFGLLALSHTQAVHGFGLTVLVGIGAAFVLSPLVARSDS
ncbi:MMPL family transporter [Dongshaea marina]|uniref:MMPL family transporter n=1 Tax=Dongshaea marina TaxID=2047966 RepID=UPI00131F1A20|nr:MMPL family transporter [Dongshaea marina]